MPGEVHPLSPKFHAPFSKALYFQRFLNANVVCSGLIVFEISSAMASPRWVCRPYIHVVIWRTCKCERDWPSSLLMNAFHAGKVSSFYPPNFHPCVPMGMLYPIFKSLKFLKILKHKCSLFRTNNIEISSALALPWWVCLPYVD